jgi:hypothetical protein
MELIGGVFWKCLRIIKDTDDKKISHESGNVPDPEYICL